MSVEYRTGDLFDQRDVQALAHGVNRKGVMGGIAGVFAAKWPRLDDQYNYTHRNYKMGKAYIFRMTKSERLHDVRYVFNLTSQNNPGADARPIWLEESMRDMLHKAEKIEIERIAVPMIGAGIGGLQDSQVKSIFEKVAEESQITLVVVELPTALN